MYVLRVGVAAALLGAMVVASPTTAAAADDDPAVVAQWNELAVNTLAADAATAPVADFLYLGFVQAAVYDAVVGVTGGYEPYHFRGTAATGSSAQAAAVAAAHGVLVEYVPGAASALDAAYAASLAQIDATAKAKQHGVTFGRHTARHFIKMRADDGRNAPVEFTQGPAPGVWRPTPPGFAPMMVPWLGGVTPLLIESSAQFAPPDPPALTSAQYTQDYLEVQSLGRFDSATRTAAQSATARFFSGNALVQYNVGLRLLVGQHDLDVADAARMFAATSMSVADGVIAVWAAKLQHAFWRPSTAIQLGDTDNNPATVGDPTWMPLGAPPGVTSPGPNPPYPEYPSGFNVVNAAIARVLVHLFGPDINLTLTGAGQTRTYHSEAVLCQDVVDARVWLGIHFRFADTAARDMGFAVADYALDNYFAPSG